MTKILETLNFIVHAPEQPLIDRADGGHIVIDPKQKVKDRQQLSATLATELMRLTTVTGEAMTIVMSRNGVDIGRINYQDNGNWGVFKPEGPFMHIHVYGRARGANVQKYGQALNLPHRDEHPEFYANLMPLNETDVLAIRKEMIRLLALSKYSDREWRFA